MTDRNLWAEVDIRLIDQRIGMGIGGHDLVVRVLHKPTGIIIEMPRITSGGSYRQRELAMGMLEYGLLEAGL